ncbi:class I SAM-dependent methyltransferase [Leptospira haakeii]|nr:class I SAM-dependent methyltransferase [Leptospira haakeii]
MASYEYYKKIIGDMPVIGNFLKWLYLRLSIFRKFPGSASYWESRYQEGGSSGAGSYNFLAEFKAEIINAFVQENKVQTIIEFGCGDGNQLKLAQYPKYIGFDISPSAISICRELFKNDKNKNFKVLSDYSNEKAELVLSLDVIYHLVEDEVFEQYIRNIFNASDKYVIIYSSDVDLPREFHVRHRKFSKWIEEHIPEWNLEKHIPNRYPYHGNHWKGSLADFFIYRKRKK